MNLIMEFKKLIRSVDEIKNKEEKIEVINKIKNELHLISPFKDEPVDCVTWVKNDIVKANEYNPNKVAPPELETQCWVPSWRRICKVLLRNDYWCKGLGQTQPKSRAWLEYKIIKESKIKIRVGNKYDPQTETNC